MNRNLVKKIISEGGSLTPLIIPSKDTNGTGLMNPSIFLDGEDLLLNLRHVNYTLYHSEGGQIFQNRWGPLSYLNPENDIHLRTNNFLCILHPEVFLINQYAKVDTSKLDIEPIWEFIGLEDARVVRWDNKLFLIGVRRDVKDNGEGRMELSEIVINKGVVKEINRFRIQSPDSDPNFYLEKNWMPVIDMPYHFIRWANPTELIKVDIKTLTTEVIFSSADYIPVPDLRGSSQVIPYKDYRICITHELNFFRNKLEQKDATYMHRFVVWDKDWNTVKITQPFSFMTGEIEFCCGMTLYKEDLLVTFGFQDNAAYLLKIPKNKIDDILELNGSPIVNKEIVKPIKSDSYIYQLDNKFDSFDFNKRIDVLKIDAKGREYELLTSENLPIIKKNVKKIEGTFNLRNKFLKEKFRNFRDTFLKEIANYQIYSVDNVDIKWDLWNEHFIEYYMVIKIFIDFKDDWRAVNDPILEITTNIIPNGCAIKCVFCPQKTIVNSYGGVRMLTLDNFKKILEKIPREIGICFAGFSEPWLNVDCTDMVVYANQKGHSVSVFTTGVGMTKDNFDRIKDIPFASGVDRGFTLHLPDNESYSKHPMNKNYIELLNYIEQYSADISNFRAITMGTVHNVIKDLFPIVYKGDMYSRSGNLEKEAILNPRLMELKDKYQSTYQDGDITCNRIEKLHHAVLLPNGDVSLCCNDYSLEYILGNLYDQEYNDIMPKHRTPFRLCNYCENGINLKS